MTRTGARGRRSRGTVTGMPRLVAIALLLAVAGCGGDRLPGPVAAFERDLEADRGVLHVVTDELRIEPEAGLPSLPPGGGNDEVWLVLGGSGWRAKRTTRDGGFEQVADAEGIRTYLHGALVDVDSPDGEVPDYRLRPWRAGMVVDPVRTVRDGRLRVLGETDVDGRPAHVLAVEPDPSLDTRLYVASDDGTLLRITHRRERADRVRTIIQDYAVFEVDGWLPRNLAEVIDRR